MTRSLRVSLKCESQELNVHDISVRGERALDKAGTAGDGVKKPLTDDIPIAQRESPTVVAKPKPTAMPWVVGGGAVILLALIAGGWAAAQFGRPTVSAASRTPVPSTSESSSPRSTGDTMLGHYAYPEAPASELEPISADGGIQLRRSAASAYQSMAAAAQQDGVSLVALSGFRTINDQQYLYFGKKAERGQSPTERAKVSAPPGYSEHHTGYAIDVGDGTVPSTNLSEEFDKTPAFRWLKENAAHYSFELSFPKNNPQGVSYEPWHWRYVGDIQSLKTFYRAHQTKP